MKKILVLLAIAGNMLLSQSCNENKKNSEDSVENAHDANDLKEQNGSGQTDDTNDFAVKAAAGGLLEVTLGQMAQEKGQSPQVKAFGQMMIEDHTKANDELKALAARKNITLPTTLGEDEQKHVDELASLSGAEFDKKYIDLMEDDHEQDVKLFSEAAQEEEDAELKAFASKTLPTLQQHLNKVKAMNTDQ
ncbi:DUF4142 domain-containing protein [Tellurirhabdus rosea]|uniref:DUF4142 domain-containing protein n=1 Tax=Tellurirhabdus rosea TaxID=2674997 RepID=UPI00224E6F52|nr:DUF4142 domain-containing protein [Tellurirhabdus rosea]